MKKKGRIRFSKIIIYLLLVFYSILTLGPYFWSAITSLKPTSEINNFSIDLSTLSFGNYVELWKRFPFTRWTLNSIIVAVIVTCGNLLFNSMAGYALARIHFPGRKTLLMSILAMMMIPGQVVMVPTFILLTKLGWINTYRGLTLPFLTSLFGIFLMRQFFLSIPQSIEEAAKIDGLGRFGTFFRIVLPMAKPALSTQFIIMFSGNWNSFLWPSLIARNIKMYTLPVGLNSFYGQYYQYWDQVLAGVMILSIPTLIVFLIF